MNPTRTWALVLTSVASLMVALDVVVVTTALNVIRLDLDASLEELEWTVNAYNLSFAVLLLTAAALGDRLGRRRVYSVGLVVFTLASAACALAPSIGWLIAARTVQGVGAAAVMPLALALLSAAFPPERRGVAIGIFGGITGLGVASGPLIGGAIAEGLSWQWIFWLNVPIGVVVIPFVLRKINESKGRDTALDLGGLALVMAGSFGLVWGLVRGNSVGWSSAEIVVALGGGALLVAAFIGWERRSTRPMVPLNFFRSRAFSAGNAAVFFLFASLTAAVFFMAQFLQTSLGHGPLGAGVRMTPWVVTLLIVAPIAGALVDRLGERPFMVGGLLLQVAGMTWIALIAAPDVAYPDLIAPLIISGCGISMAMPAAQNSVLGSVAPESVGKASGVNSMMRELGAVFGVAISVAVFAAAGSYTSAQAFTDGFISAIGGSAVLALAGVMAGACLPGRRPAPAQKEPVPVLEATR